MKGMENAGDDAIRVRMRKSFIIWTLVVVTASRRAAVMIIAPPARSSLARAVAATQQLLRVTLKHSIVLCVRDLILQHYDDYGYSSSTMRNMTIIIASTTERKNP